MVPNGGNGEEGVNHGLRELRGTGKAWEFLAAKELKWRRAAEPQPKEL